MKKSNQTISTLGKQAIYRRLVRCHSLRQVTYQALFLTALVAVLPQDRANSDERLWRAGVARCVITPEQPVWLAGYGSKRVPEGKIHDLWLKVLALQDSDNHRVVLITSDFQGVPRSMSDRVFQRLDEQYDLKRTDVIFTFSHNHCGPRLGDDLIDYYPIENAQEMLVAEYTRNMEQRVVTTVGEALSQMTMAHLGTSFGEATFAVNRRNNREADVATLLARGEPLRGPVDHRVPVLKVTRADGSLLAILFGYACHPTTLSFNQWCGDYPGFAQVELEERYQGATALFVNTCGGDQNPLPRRSVELCQKYGHELAEGVQQAMSKPFASIEPMVTTSFTYVELPYEKVMDRTALHEALRDSNPIRGRWAARMLQQLDQGIQFPSSYPYPLHVWRLGNRHAIIAMGAETVVDYALRFKRQYGENTWVCGYADDMIAYIPSRRVWEEGGYEGGSNLYEYGRPALRWSGTIEDRIAQSVDQLTAEVGLPRIASE